MKKVLNMFLLLILCGCLTTTTTPPVQPEPELAIKKEPAPVIITKIVEAQQEADIEIINLKQPETAQKPPLQPVVLIKTSVGDIKVKLNQEKAPGTVKNFLNYVEKKHYNGTVFHRVIANFMIQGGGFTKNLERKKTDNPIKNEADNGLSNNRGTIAMARTSVVDSATNQFFINVKDNAFLNHKDRSAQRFGYCVFGEVIDGMDVVDKIKNVKTVSHSYFRDIPAENIVIKEIVRVPESN